MAILLGVRQGALSFMVDSTHKATYSLLTYTQELESRLRRLVGNTDKYSTEDFKLKIPSIVSYLNLDIKMSLHFSKDSAIDIIELDKHDQKEAQELLTQAVDELFVFVIRMVLPSSNIYDMIVHINGSSINVCMYAVPAKAAAPAVPAPTTPVTPAPAAHTPTTPVVPPVAPVTPVAPTPAATPAPTVTPAPAPVVPITPAVEPVKPVTPSVEPTKPVTPVAPATPAVDPPKPIEPHKPVEPAAPTDTPKPTDTPTEPLKPTETTT